MKKIFVFKVLLLILFSNSLVTAQNNQDFALDCMKISELDQLIFELDTKVSDISNDSLYLKLSNKYNPLKIRRIVRCELLPLIYEKIDLIGSYLDCIHRVETLTWLEFIVTDLIDKKEKNISYNSPYSTPYELKKFNALIHDRLDELMEVEFSMYKFPNSSKKWVRSIYVNHTNDVFSFHNQDRDMTGAFKIELMTDYLQLRIISSFENRWRNFNSRSWYSYQSLFVGGEGYTPYLRDTSIFTNEFSVDTLDRPFASFTYFGRGKYRIFRNGKFRVISNFKIGSIGSLSPNKIQSAIHRDLTIGSVKPNGWSAQIAAGGRIAFSWEGLSEYLVNIKKKHKYLPYSSFLIETKLGHQMTSIGLGINFSNRNLKERGGVDISFNRLKFNCTLNYKGLVRYVIHNSMLEGYGIFKRTPDEDSTSPIDRYFVKSEHINRFIFIHEFSIVLNFKYVGLIFRQNFMSPEFDIKYPDIPSGLPASRNEAKWNHVGTVGVIFKI